MDNQPLVSICVITYRSAGYVLETLESAYKQSYQNIELIVSDDHSPDKTVEICRKWIESHKDRFVRTELVVAPENMGTSANYNRAIYASKGEWIKTIDGDDILLPNCIEDNLNFVEAHPESRFVFSDYIAFSGTNDERKEWESGFTGRTSKFFELDAEGQLKLLLKRNILPSPTSFLHGATTRQYGFNENYKYIEDSPMWIKLTSEGYRMYSFETKTVLYRQQESVSKSKKKFYSPLFYGSNLQFFWNERVFLIRKYNLNEAYQYNRKAFFMSEVADLLFNNKRNFFTNIIYKTLYWVVNKWGSFKF